MRLIPAWLQRLEVCGNIKVQGIAATTLFGGIARAGTVALSVVRLGRVVGKHAAAVALVAELGASIRVALLLAGGQARLRSQGGSVGFRVPGQGAARSLVGVAAE